MTDHDDTCVGPIALATAIVTRAVADAELTHDEPCDPADRDAPDHTPDQCASIFLRRVRWAADHDPDPADLTLFILTGVVQ